MVLAVVRVVMGRRSRLRELRMQQSSNFFRPLEPAIKFSLDLSTANLLNGHQLIHGQSDNT